MTTLLVPLAENPLLPAPAEIIAAIVFALLSLSTLKLR